MLQSTSTEALLNSFPMFGHPGISALEYAGSLEAVRERKSTSAVSDSNKTKSSISTHDNTISPASSAAGSPTLLADLDISPLQPSPIVDELGSQKGRRGTFLNHTPRDLGTRSSMSAVEVYRPYRPPSSNENYSRPRKSPPLTQAPTQYDSNTAKPLQPASGTQKRLTINPGAPIELDATEKRSPTFPPVYEPSAHRRSFSASYAGLEAYQPRSPFSLGEDARGPHLRSASNIVHKTQEKKRQRRQTPFKLTTAELHKGTPVQQLEKEAPAEMPPAIDTKKVEELGTFGVIQRYFDSQTGGPVSAPKQFCNDCCYSPPPGYVPGESQLEKETAPQRSAKDTAAIYPIDELDFEYGDEEPPAVPDRSPKRLTNPSFPALALSKTTLSMDSEFAFAAEGQYSPWEEKSANVLHVPKKRAPKRINIGQVVKPVGSSTLGRMAPPILGHDALIASSELITKTSNIGKYVSDRKLHAQEFRYFLRHTGPTTTPEPATKKTSKNGIRIFKAKHKNSLAARVGSVESSPQRARRQSFVPPSVVCPMVTSSGARHLRIIAGSDSKPSSTHTLSLPGSRSGTQRRSRHVSITFTDEMLQPLASPQLEQMLTSCATPIDRSFSEPTTVLQRSPKRTPPKAPEPEPAPRHPLSTREELTRARKLRDRQRVKRKPLPGDVAAPATNEDEHKGDDYGAKADLPTPAHTPEPVDHAASPTLVTSPDVEIKQEVDSVHDDDAQKDIDIEKDIPVVLDVDVDADIDEDDPINKMTRLQSRVVVLQRQNTALTEALARIVGLQISADGEVSSEEVLKAVVAMKNDRQTSDE